MSSQSLRSSTKAESILIRFKITNAFAWHLHMHLHMQLPRPFLETGFFLRSSTDGSRRSRRGGRRPFGDFIPSCRLPAGGLDIKHKALASARVFFSYVTLPTVTFPQAGGGKCRRAWGLMGLLGRKPGLVSRRYVWRGENARRIFRVGGGGCTRCDFLSSCKMGFTAPFPHSPSDESSPSSSASSLLSSFSSGSGS